MGTSEAERSQHRGLSQEASQASSTFPETSLWGGSESEGRSGGELSPGSTIGLDPPFVGVEGEVNRRDPFGQQTAALLFYLLIH